MTTTAPRLALLALALAVALCGPSAAPPAMALSTADPVPVDPPVGSMLAGSYIVSMQDGADAADLAADLGVSPKHVYSTALDGFAARLSPDQLSDVQHNPDVVAIEHDQMYHTDDGGPATQAVGDAAGLYGLDRIDQRRLPLSGTYTSAAPTGTVYAYVLDKLIDTTHPDFGGRAQNVFTVVATPPSADPSCFDHGTHVAGTIGGATFGVAKSVQLRGVRVLNCKGEGVLSGVIAAVDWVRAHAQRPAVANLSLGGGLSPMLNDAVTALVDSGVSVAVAAGNEDADACFTSPASAVGVVTVAASSRTDAKTWFSNWGRCVDLYAPGEDITSAAPGAGMELMSGTSMASPHVAGAMALAKASGDRRSSEIRRWLIRHATAAVVADNPPGTPNRLLHTDGG